MKTTKVANVGSVPSITGTGAGSASNITPPQVATSNTVAPAPVVGKKGLRLRLQEMLAGFQAAIPAGSVLPDAPNQGPPLTQAAIVAQLQGLVGIYTALDTATLALQSARAPVKASGAAATALLAHLKEVLVGFFGASSPQLALFGPKPKTARRKLSAEEMAAKTARGANTRKIRGTMGKLQKADLASGPIAVTTAPTTQSVAAAPAVGQGSPPGGSGK